VDAQLEQELRRNNELWDFFTRKEEYSPMFLDNYQRFPYYLSINRDILEPRVSAFLIENGLEVEYHEGKRFAVCLTHDIDAVYLSRAEIGFSAATSLVKHQVKNAFKMSSKMIRRWRPLWNFKDIMALEEKYGAKSSFYFLSLEEKDTDFSYRIQDLENELGNIVDKGWEVGLHGGHRAYDSLDEIRAEKERLEKVLGRKVIGYRNHFLRFRVPTTWEVVSSAGFGYDTTFSYMDMIGFRNGMCHPFRPFNLNTNEEIDLLEIPLNIQDMTLGETCMRLDVERAFEVTKYLIDTVEKYHGVITILWHNSHLLDEKTSQVVVFDKGLNKKFYEKILDYSSKKNAWITSGEEIWKQWTQNKPL
jgi:peptidoglycan/xylan/chitin deacetylase (PgdA/CDA1 family)